MKTEFLYGFEYISLTFDDDISMLYRSSEIEFAISNLIGLMKLRVGPLVYGYKVYFNLKYFLNIK